MISSLSLLCILCKPPTPHTTPCSSYIPGTDLNFTLNFVTVHYKQWCEQLSCCLMTGTISGLLITRYWRGVHLQTTTISPLPKAHQLRRTHEYGCASMQGSTAQ